jgi:hypothetical protein
VEEGVGGFGHEQGAYCAPDDRPLAFRGDTKSVRSAGTARVAWKASAKAIQEPPRVPESRRLRVSSFHAQCWRGGAFAVLEVACPNRRADRRDSSPRRVFPVRRELCPYLRSGNGTAWSSESTVSGPSMRRTSKLVRKPSRQHRREMRACPTLRFSTSTQSSQAGRVGAT